MYFLLIGLKHVGLPGFKLTHWLYGGYIRLCTLFVDSNRNHWSIKLFLLRNSHRNLTHRQRMLEDMFFLDCLEHLIAKHAMIESLSFRHCRRLCDCLGPFVCVKALLHDAINCSCNCNRIAATFECVNTQAISIALVVAEGGFCIGSVKPDS